MREVASDRGALTERLDDGLARLGGAAAGLDARARERLVHFVELLAKWNRVHNLTAVREPREMIGRHVLDSLALLPWVLATAGPSTDAAGAARSATTTAGTADEGRIGAAHLVDLVDIGSGGGLPVLPLAVAVPSLRCLSVESNNKKVRFQRQAALELELAGVEVRHARIEDIVAQGGVRARTLVSRAFAAPVDFLRLAAPLCAPGATVLVMLGRAERLPESLPEPFTLGELHALDVPFESGERHLAVCRAR